MVVNVKGRFDEHTSEMLFGAVSAFIVRVLSAGLSFGFNVALSRLLGAELSGVFFLGFAVVMVASTVGRMGLDNTLLRYIASSVSVNDWGAVNGASKKGVALGLAASVVVSALCFLASDLLAVKVFSKPEAAWTLRWMSLAIVPVSMLTLHAEMLKGLKKVKEALVVQGVGIWGLSLLLMLPLYTFGINGIIVAYLFGASLTAGVGILLWRSSTRAFRGVRPRFDTAKLLKSCSPLFVSSVFTMLMSWTGVFFLGIWGSNSDVAFFSVALRTSQLIMFILVAVNSIAAPKFAELYSKKEMDTLGRLARNSAKVLSLLTLPVLILFLVFPSGIMGVFGEEFRAGAVALALLSIGQFVNVSTGSVGYLLMMSGNEKIMRNIVLTTAILNIVLNVALIPGYGLTGAAVATAVSLIFLNLGSVYLAKKIMGINTLPWIGGSSAY